MNKLLGIALFFLALVSVPHLLSADDPIPTIPNAGTITGTRIATTTAAVQSKAEVKAPLVPVRVRIPAIKLNDRIVPVGKTKDGAMDVPSGNTSDIGWYKYGTTPGDVGSAVFDAHVFAALANLYKLKAGDDIYVMMSDGTERHFVVEKSVVYKLADVPAAKLFARDDTERLNLITCEGKLTRDHSTYDHRRVVYATLVH
ncbi:MAG TPA: class F sortase [Candidatus Paceibacterota bacterium]|nr:class F sortase [Candidatus Paceibacterota bacterium]